MTSYDIPTRILIGNLTDIYTEYCSYLLQVASNYVQRQGDGMLEQLSPGNFQHAPPRIATILTQPTLDVCSEVGHPEGPVNVFFRIQMGEKMVYKGPSVIPFYETEDYKVSVGWFNGMVRVAVYLRDGTPFSMIDYPYKHFINPLEHKPASFSSDVDRESDYAARLWYVLHFLKVGAGFLLHKPPAREQEKIPQSSTHGEHCGKPFDSFLEDWARLLKNGEATPSVEAIAALMQKATMPVAFFKTPAEVSQANQPPYRAIVQRGKKGKSRRY